MSRIFACNTSNGGEMCINLPGTFKCECNDNLGFVLIDGICQSKFKRSLYDIYDYMLLFTLPHHQCSSSSLYSVNDFLFYASSQR